MFDTNTLSRRDLLEAAGGMTFLALLPDGRGAYAATIEANPAASGNEQRAAPPPVFTAVPYIQPGPHGSLLIDGLESIVLAWQTNEQPAEFAVTVDGGGRVGSLTRTECAKATAESPAHYNYATQIAGLRLSTRYSYKVTINGDRLAEGFFTTRKRRGDPARFVAFGDNSFGDISDRMIAYEAYRAKPDFVMNTGDNVYDSGLDDEYARHFFPVYNAELAAPRVGAPLLRSVPFYTVIANHDVAHRGPEGGPVADFDRNPDSLAYYTAMHLPLNGPESPAYPTPAVGAETIVNAFRAAATGRFPRMANYSFDYGDAHFVCLDANDYIDPTDAMLQAWIESDLKDAADAPWKIVVYHHPAFNVGKEHYAEQHMRALCPLLERNGVNLVLNGHEHVYQRSRPIRFLPADPSAAKAVNSAKRLVPGTFTIDRMFDGDKNQAPSGIIYITTGAGGKNLYDPTLSDNPANWLRAEDNNADYVARFISDRHSLTVIDIDARSLVLRQVDQWGTEIDKVRITRSI